MSTTWTRRSFMSAAAAAGVGGLMLPYGVGMLRDDAEAQMQPLGVRFDAAPFPLGVASGDPTADSVILQTRLSDMSQETDRLRQANTDLRETIQALREAGEEKLGDPAKIDTAMAAELESLRAVQATSEAEARAILDALAPLLAEKKEDA